MTRSVGSERNRVKYASGGRGGGGGAPSCVLQPGADNPHYTTVQSVHQDDKMHSTTY